MHFRKDLYFQKNNRGRHVLYCCSAHAFWSPFPRKGLRFHKNNRENNRGQGVLYCCSWYASLLPHQSDLQRRQKNRQKKSCSWPHCHKPRNQLFYTQAKPLPPVSAFCSQPESVSALCSQPDFVSLHKQEKGHQDLPARYFPYGPDDRHQSQNYHQLSAHLLLPSPLCDLYSKNHSIRNNEFRSFFPFPSVFQPFSVSFLT